MITVWNILITQGNLKQRAQLNSHSSKSSHSTADGTIYDAAKAFSTTRLRREHAIPALPYFQLAPDPAKCLQTSGPWRLTGEEFTLVDFMGQTTGIGGKSTTFMYLSKSTSNLEKSYSSRSKSIKKNCT